LPLELLFYLQNNLIFQLILQQVFLQRSLLFWLLFTVHGEFSEASEKNITKNDLSEQSYKNFKTGGIHAFLVMGIFYKLS
jgi:hypothetical protein